MYCLLVACEVAHILREAFSFPGIFFHAIERTYRVLYLRGRHLVSKINRIFVGAARQHAAFHVFSYRRIYSMLLPLIPYMLDIEYQTYIHTYMIFTALRVLQI